MAQNNVITASRINTLLRCKRAHYWRYEVGLDRLTQTYALYFGSAWARAMEARWQGKEYAAALEAALPEGVELDAYGASTVASLLLCYYEYYGMRETYASIHPEVAFSFPIQGMPGFTAAGKMDGLGQRHDDRTGFIEGKTTSNSLDAQSKYWDRLRFNVQLLQYAVSAPKLGWNVSEVTYDVTRKPSIRPKMITDYDASGFKIVLEADGSRAVLKKGGFKQSADKKAGQVLKRHRETPDEYSERLIKDIRSRPDFYFVRREVPILEDDIEDFMSLRYAVANDIVATRTLSEKLERPEQAWQRSVGEHNCNFCSFASFCLQNIRVNLESPPDGFAIKPFNPELENENTASTFQEPDAETDTDTADQSGSES